MDDGKGNFEQFDTLEDAQKRRKELAEFEQKVSDIKGTVENDGIFREGEIVEIRGSRFRIKGIRPNGKMILKLLSRKEEKA